MRKRHYCNCCKKKRDEKFMINTGRQTRYGKDVWVCDDDFCKERVFVY